MEKSIVSKTPQFVQFLRIHTNNPTDFNPSENKQASHHRRTAFTTGNRRPQHNKRHDTRKRLFSDIIIIRVSSVGRRNAVGIRLRSGGVWNEFTRFPIKSFTGIPNTMCSRVHKALSCHAGYCYVYTHSRYVEYVRCIFNECLTDCVTSTAVR